MCVCGCVYNQFVYDNRYAFYSQFDSRGLPAPGYLQHTLSTMVVCVVTRSTLNEIENVCLRYELHHRAQGVHARLVPLG